MKFLNYNKVLCLSPHPDDVEISMMGSIIKSSDTHFDILCLTKGGAKGFDATNKSNRRGEILNVWNETGCSNISLFDSKIVDHLSINDETKAQNNTNLVDYFNKYQAFCFDLCLDSVLKGDLNFTYE